MKNFGLLAVIPCLFASEAWAVMPASGVTPAYRSGEVLVRYHDAGGTAAKALHASAGFVSKASWAEGRGELLQLPSPMDVPGAVALLERDPAVAYAEPNYLRRPRSVTPNDPLFNQQWGLSNTGQPNFFANGPAGTPGGDLHLTDAWDLDGDGVADHTGRGMVTVAVIDDAVETTHPDLAPNLVAGYNFVNNSTDPNPSSADQDHGTSVAGCVAAVGNNGMGVSGAAWNEKIMPLKFGFDVATGVRAMQFARDNGAKIINASYGGPGYSQTEVDSLRDLASRDILFVTAAGNEDSNTDIAGASYPANYPVPNVLAVAATNRQDGVASFSSFGPTTVQVAAPGLQIVTTTINGGYTTNPGISGTSFASPYTAGVAALLRDYIPAATYREVEARLIEGADPGLDTTNPVRSRTAGGRVNAARALRLAAGPSLLIQPVQVGSYTQQYGGTQTVPIRVPVVVADGRNGTLDAGETANVQVTLQNIWQDATNVRGTLTASGGGVTAASAAVSFGNVASGATASGSFSVSVPAVVSGHQYVDFTLNLTADGGYSAARHFMLELGQLANGTAVTQTIGTGLYDEFHTWHFDVASVPSGANLVFTTTAANDIDILVSYGRPAQYQITLGATADDANNVFYVNQPNELVGGARDGNETVTIPSPQVGTYFVTVLDYDRTQNATYTLKATLATAGGTTTGGTTGGAGSIHEPHTDGGDSGAISPLVLGMLMLAAGLRRRSGTR